MSIAFFLPHGFINRTGGKTVFASNSQLNLGFDQFSLIFNGFRVFLLDQTSAQFSIEPDEPVGPVFKTMFFPIEFLFCWVKVNNFHSL